MIQRGKRHDAALSLFAGDDIPSLQHLLETIWEYQAQMSENSISDPGDFVARCRLMKSQALEERASVRPPGSASSESTSMYSHTPLELTRLPAPAPTQHTEAYRMQQSVQQYPSALQQPRPTTPLTQAQQVRSQVSSTSPQRRQDSSPSLNTMSSNSSSDRSVTSSGSRTGSSGYSSNSSAISDVDEGFSTGSSFVSQVSSSTSYQPSSLGIGQSTVSSGYYTGLSSNTSDFDSQYEVGSLNMSDTSSGFQSGTGSTSDSNRNSRTSLPSSTPVDRLCKVQCC